MEEIWKDIDGYEGVYQISNLGNVKSLNYCGRGYAKNLTPKCNNSGRLWVELAFNGNKKPMLIHRLVAIAFIPNPNGYPQVNHMDENPKNNRVDNLEWCTGSYNIRYSLMLHPERTKIFRHRNRKSGTPYKHKREVIQFSKSGDEICKFPNILTVCAENNWRSSHLVDCCNGKRKTAYGYIWRFAS